LPQSWRLQLGHFTAPDMPESQYKDIVVASLIVQMVVDAAQMQSPGVRQTSTLDRLAESRLSEKQLEGVAQLFAGTAPEQPGGYQPTILTHGARRAWRE
jgi:hypothetical protein